MLIKATLSNARHPEYGEVTIPFPIKTSEYDRMVVMTGGIWRNMEKILMGVASVITSHVSMKPCWKTRCRRKKVVA